MWWQPCAKALVNCQATALSLLLLANEHPREHSFALAASSLLVLLSCPHHEAFGCESPFCSFLRVGNIACADDIILPSSAGMYCAGGRGASAAECPGVCGLVSRWCCLIFGFRKNRGNLLWPNRTYAMRYIIFKKHVGVRMKP